MADSREVDPYDEIGWSPTMKFCRRLKESWVQESSEWTKRRLDKDRWVYLWADGIYSEIRPSTDRLCALVIVGVNDRGEKHFLAIEDGMRESIQSWKDVLLDLKERGLSSPNSRSGMEPWDSGTRWRKSFPKRSISGVEFIRPPMFSTTFRTPFRRRPRKASMRSGCRKVENNPRRRSTRFLKPTKPNTRKPRNVF